MDFEVPDDFSVSMFLNQAMIAENVRWVGWEDGVQGYTDEHEADKYVNTFDIQNRLIKSFKKDPVTGLNVSGMKIVYP